MFEKITQILGSQDILKFNNYEEYLESFITARDLFHLRSKSISRKIIELGYHTPGTLDRDTFYDRVTIVKRYLYLLENPYALCSEFTKPRDKFLKELAHREQANRQEKIYTIIFMRHSGKSLSQISAYIDYNHRLKSEDWKPYFENIQKIMPRKNDLSYYNWKSGTSILNDTPNFKPIIDGKIGLVFQSKHNSKLISLDSSLSTESNPTRVSIHSKMYGHIVLYDYHVQEQESD